MRYHAHVSYVWFRVARGLPPWCTYWPSRTLPAMQNPGASVKVNPREPWQSEPARAGHPARLTRFSRQAPALATNPIPTARQDICTRYRAVPRSVAPGIAVVRCRETDSTWLSKSSTLTSRSHFWTDICGVMAILHSSVLWKQLLCPASGKIVTRRGIYPALPFQHGIFSSQLQHIRNFHVK